MIILKTNCFFLDKIVHVLFTPNPNLEISILPAVSDTIPECVCFLNNSCCTYNLFN